jgi:hypothetical protein
MANQKFSGFVWGVWPLAGFEAINPYKSHPRNSFSGDFGGECIGIQQKDARQPTQGLEGRTDEFMS